MALLKYTVLRLALFAVTAGVLYLVGLRDFLLLVVALLVSGLVSLFVLHRTRDDVSTALTGRISEVNRRMDERAAAEDRTDPPAGPDGPDRPHRPSGEPGTSDSP